MLKLENEIYLYLLFAIPFIVLLYIIYRKRRTNALKSFASEKTLNFLIPDVSKAKNLIGFILLTLSFGFLVLGLTNPQVGTKMKEVKREGVEVIIAVDVSNSMLAEDIRPNRLERAKSSIRNLINDINQDKIGIVLFAGDSFLQLPLTTDYSAAKLLVSTINTDLIERQGTAIGSAIDLATKSFSENTDIKKVLIVITDGENHEDDALGAAEDAADNGIIIQTVGMGSVKGAPVPNYENGQKRGHLKDNQGNTVVSKLNANMLQELAAVGNGSFVRAGTGSVDLTKILRDIADLEKTEFESKVFTDFEDRFQYVFLAALLFLLFESLLSDRQNKVLTLKKLFGENK